MSKRKEEKKEDSIKIELEQDENAIGMITYIKNKIEAQWPEHFCTNEINGKRWVLKELPWDTSNVCYKKFGRVFTTLDESFMLSWFQNNTKDLKLQKMTPNFKYALDQVFGLNRYNPIKTYLESLKWDGKPRLKYLLNEVFLQNLEIPKEDWEDENKKLKKNFLVNVKEETDSIDKERWEDDNYVMSIIKVECLKKFFIGAVKRIYEPGCDFQYIPVIYGPQGCGKSSFLKNLAKEPEWFSCNIKVNEGFNAARQDLEQFEGKWVCEFAELDGLGKNNEKIKNFITRNAEEARKSYGRGLDIIPRKFVLAGTTNNSKFLSDPTGNRRFWILDIKIPENCSPTKLAENINRVMNKKIKQNCLYRDMLWAEAVAIYKESLNNNIKDNYYSRHTESYPLFFSSECEEKLDLFRAKFLKYDPIEIGIRNYVNFLYSENTKNNEKAIFFTYDMIIPYLMEKDVPGISNDQTTKRRINSVLKNIYGEKIKEGRTSVNGTQQRGFTIYF